MDLDLDVDTNQISLKLCPVWDKTQGTDAIICHSRNRSLSYAILPSRFGMTGMRLKLHAADTVTDHAAHTGLWRSEKVRAEHCIAQHVCPAASVACGK